MTLERATLLLGCLLALTPARAQEQGEPSYAELLELVRRLESQLGAQGEQIVENRAEITRLRAALATAQPPPTGSVLDLPDGAPVPPPADGTRTTRVDVRSDHKDLLSVRLGGRVELEYVDTQNERTSPAGETLLPNGHFQVDKVRLSLEARATENVHASTKLDFNGDGGVGIDEAFVEFDHLPAKAKLSVGKRRRFIEMDRRVESYPLLANAFWRARDIGLQGRFSVGDLTVHGSLTNGLALRLRGVGEDPSFPAIFDGPRNTDLGQAKELGVGIEYDLDLGKKTDLEVMAFAYFGRMDDPGLELLALIQEPTPSMDRDRRFYGFNLDFDWRGFELQGQFISADEGADLDRLGWTLQPSWKIDLPGVDAFGSQWLTAVRPLFRYSSLRNDFLARPESSPTWNRTAYTAALAVDITDRTQLYVEQTWNREDPGHFGIRNDEFLVHLRLNW